MIESEYFQDPRGSCSPGGSSVTSMVNYRMFVDISNTEAGNNRVRWARMKEFLPSNVMPTISFGELTTS
ncbi:MAG: hypothetical protein ABSA11_09735 [Candidatus Bathyarchaeia archaeon]